MIAGILAFATSMLGRVGLGWAFSFFGKGMFGAILGPLAKLFTVAADLLLIVGKWIVEKILNGLNHIIKSVPAVATCLLLAWGSYSFGKITAHAPQAKTSVSKKKSRAPPPTKYKRKRHWMDNVWGNN